jgi:outer membrane protein
LDEGYIVRVLRKGFFAAAILATTALSPASAETISGAMAKAYQNNSTMNSARAGVRATDENVAIAKSGWRPTIAGSSSVSYLSESGVVGPDRLTVGSFGIEIQQRLFDGFQTRNNVRAAEARVRASNESLRNTEQTVLFDAATAFMDVIRARAIEDLTRQNLQFLEEQVRAANSRFEVGEGTRTDVAQAEASRSSAVAQLASARANVLSAEAVYRRVIGDSPGRLTRATAAKGLPKNLDEAFAIAAEQHPAILATEHLVDAAGFVVKSNEGALLPQLSASAGLSRSLRSTSPAASGIFGTGDGQSDSATIGATLTVPLYQGGRVAAQVRQSKEELGQSRIEVDVTRDQVRAAVASAWAQFIAAQESTVANREEVSAAKLALNGVIEERNVGQRTTLDVLDAQADVITAQINLVSSERDVVVASYAIQSATGRLSAGRTGLAVVEYKPDEHYNAVKDKWFGLRTPDGR